MTRELSLTFFKRYFSEDGQSQMNPKIIPFQSWKSSQTLQFRDVITEI